MLEATQQENTLQEMTLEETQNVRGSGFFTDFGPLLDQAVDWISEGLKKAS